MSQALVLPSSFVSRATYHRCLSSIIDVLTAGILLADAVGSALLAISAFMSNDGSSGSHVKVMVAYLHMFVLIGEF